MFDHELEWLYDQASRSQLIVEIGVWKGRSTAALCLGAQKFAENTGMQPAVIAIDWFEGSRDELQAAHREASTPDGRTAIEEAARRNLSPWLEMGLLFLCPREAGPAARELAAVLKYRPIDMLFIDGGHDQPTVEHNIDDYLPLVRRGGRVCGHDRTWPGVAAAIATRLPNYQPGPGSLWLTTKD